MRTQQKRTAGMVALTLLLAVLIGAGWFLPAAQGPLLFENQAVRERIGFDSRVDSYVYNGADVRWYSDDHSTEIHRVDAAGGAKFAAPTAQATATPGVVVDCAHVGTCLEVRIDSTPVAYYDSSGNYTGTGTRTETGAQTFGSDGSGVDVTFYSSTSGDQMLWDASEEGLYITGTAGQDALDIVDGNVDIADDLDVDGTTNLDVVDIDGAVDVGNNTISNIGAAGTDFDQAGGLTTAAGITVTAGALDLGGLFQPSFADEEITDGETLTATVTVYALDSAGAVTMTLAASADEGQILILIGDDANDITIADTNLRSSDGNAIVLNQYDILMLVYQDSEWIELAKTTAS